jgi:FlaA1/EpsC-like NDP-sugar epimerase|tara:strand:- start:306 stop:452 length:147 start_codon:yes stop_codon:yes gene_type:complete
VFDVKKVLITGSTGFLGTTTKILQTNVDTIRIFSRDELKQVLIKEKRV